MRIARRGVLAMGLFSLVSTWWPAKAKPRSFANVAEFRQFIMTVLQQRRLVQSVAADPADPAKFAMTVGRDSSTVDVTNIYGHINAYPRQNTDALINRFIRSITEDHDEGVDDGSIVAVIRNREYVDSMPPEVLQEPLGADLVTLYMVDGPDSMAPLTKPDMPGKDLASVRKIALANVGKWLPKVVADNRLGAGVLYYVEGNTMLSSSLILLDDFWKSIAVRFPGDVLIALPRRDQLFLFDDDGNAESRAAVRRLIDATFEDGFNLLSPQLYARRGGKLIAISN